MEEYRNFISENLDQPAQLERLYREDPEKFSRAFPLVFKEHQNLTILKVWHERLSFDTPNETKESDAKWKDLLLIIIIALLAGTIARFLFSAIDKSLINPANIVFSVLPLLSFYFLVKNRPAERLVLTIGLSYLATIIYLNFLPVKNSDSIILSNLHLPFFLVSLVALAFIGDFSLRPGKIMEFLKYAGELLIGVALILICGACLTALTIGLFSAIQINIEEFYMKNIVIFGIAAAPFVGTYLTRARGKVTKNFAPYLAKIFSPLVLITLGVYLVTIIITQKNPYTDREFLLIFNLMLLLVLAITIFSVSERETGSKIAFNDRIIFALLTIAIMINCVALSAILFRLTSYGLSPNRLAVLGMNLLVFVHLISITVNHCRFLLGKVKIQTVEATITRYLPIYSLWALMVTIFFPIIFAFK